jgi:DNA repair protein RadC
MKIPLPKFSPNRIKHMEEVFEIMLCVLKRENKLHRRREHFWVMGLGRDSSIQYLELSALGGLNAVNIEAVEIFSFATQKKCKRVILVHNHTSTSKLIPSELDIEVTAKLILGGKFIGVKVEEHLIFNEKGYLCLSERFDFKKLGRIASDLLRNSIQIELKRPTKRTGKK